MKAYAYARPSVLPAALASERALNGRLVPQVHQLQARAELALAVAPTGIEGISGFTGIDIRTTDRWTVVRGVPPRGRPV